MQTYASHAFRLQYFLLNTHFLHSDYNLSNEPYIIGTPLSRTRDAHHTHTYTHTHGQYTHAHTLGAPLPRKSTRRTPLTHIYTRNCIYTRTHTTRAHTHHAHLSLAEDAHHIHAHTRTHTRTHMHTHTRRTSKGSTHKHTQNTSSSGSSEGSTHAHTHTHHTQYFLLQLL